eukprot:361217-Chlamydomonas_euryale.AAC.10
MGAVVGPVRILPATLLLAIVADSPCALQACCAPRTLPPSFPAFVHTAISAVGVKQLTEFADGNMGETWLKCGQGCDMSEYMGMPEVVYKRLSAE